MIIRKLVAGMLLVLGPMIGTAHAVAKENYRPYAHAYPQIIQEHDYSTIEGIEGLLTELKKLPKGDLSCTLSKDSISLNRPAESSGGIVVTSPEKGPVTISGVPYGSKNCLVLFSTLRKLIVDLSVKTPCGGVRYDQFATRAYKKRTIIEFNFGQEVVVLDALSNGPIDEERLYVLDLIDMKDSFFWRH